MNMQTPPPAKSSSAPWIIAVGAVTFAIGAVGAFDAVAHEPVAPE